MKNVHLACSNKLLTHFGLLSPKTFDSYFLDMMCVVFMKIILLADSSQLLAVTLILAFSPKTFDSYFLDMMCVVFMKIILLADSNWQASPWLLDSFRPSEPKNV